MVRGDIPRLFPAKNQTILGKARILSLGSDITLLTSGICTEESLRVTDILKDRGIGVQHLHVTTLKPFDDHRVSEALAKARYGIITMENHTSIGGLGSCVAEMIAKFGIATKLIKVAINDTYLQGASRTFLMERYGIDVKALLSAIESLVGEKIDISDADLTTSRQDSFFNENQQEAL